MTKPDAITISKEVFDVLSEACGCKDDTHSPTNRKARRAAESERRRSLRRPT